MKYLRKFNEEFTNFTNFKATNKGNLLELGKFINEEAGSDKRLFVPKSNHWIYAKSNMVLVITNDYDKFYDSSSGPFTRDSHRPTTVEDFLDQLKKNFKDSDEFSWMIDEEVAEDDLYGLVIKVVPSNQTDTNPLSRFSNEELLAEVKRRGL